MLYFDLIFILGFFPILTFLSFLDRSAEYKNLLLIVGSVLFLSWGRPFYVCAALLTSVLDWFISLLMDKIAGSRALRKALLFADVLMNFSVTVFVGQDFLNKAPKCFSMLDSVLPLCIGGICLRGMAYVFEVYRREIRAEKNYFCLLTYTSSLHLLCAGGAVGYKAAEPAIRRREITINKLSRGLTEIFLGMGKSAILYPAFDKISGIAFSSQGRFNVIIGICAFLIGNYFLFTGLWDMSKGMGLANGFDYPKNYSHLSAKGLFSGIADSFNSSCVHFFKIAFRLDGRNKFVPTLLCYVAIALWYKVSVTFLLMGTLAGIVCAVEQTTVGDKLRKVPAAVRFVYVFVLSTLILSLAYYGDITAWARGLTNFRGDRLISTSLEKVLLNHLWLIIIGLVCAFEPLVGGVRKICLKASQKSSELCKAVRYAEILFTVLVFAAAVILSAGVDL